MTFYLGTQDVRLHCENTHTSRILPSRGRFVTFTLSIIRKYTLQLDNCRSCLHNLTSGDTVCLARQSIRTQAKGSSLWVCGPGSASSRQVGVQASARASLRLGSQVGPGSFLDRGFRDRLEEQLSPHCCSVTAPGLLWQPQSTQTGETACFLLLKKSA